MCEILTVIAACISTTLFFILKAKFQKTWCTGKLALAYWGASLMWLVDCIVNVIDGLPFFDMSREDALLGLAVIGCGIVLWGIFFAIEKIRSRKTS